MTDIVLTSEQECALFEIRTWFVDKLKPVWRLKGYAGTGKTSLMKFILACDDFRTNKGIAVVAYTHKAASVLRKKGIPQAGTIHGLIYKPIELPNGDVIYDRAPKHEVADAYGLIVVDEASMVSKAMRADIESFGIPVLYVGDAGQLPPIENGADRDKVPGQFMDEAESQLIQIHRQAADSPIIRLATMIREGKRIPMGKFGKGVFIIEEDELEDDILLSSDQIIVGKNDTRRYYNKLIRKLKGFKVARYPTEGERVMVLENNREFGLFNGMVLVSAEDNNSIHLATGVGITHKFYRPGDATPMPTEISHMMKHIPPTHGGMVEFKPYFDGTNPDIIDIATERHFLKSKGLIKVDFSEAISCHKSQGSSYVKPIVIEEQINRDRSFHRKWLYTAVTRAEQKLILVRPSYN